MQDDGMGAMTDEYDPTKPHTFVDYEWGCTIEEFKLSIDRALLNLPLALRSSARVYVYSQADEGLLPNIYLQ